MLTIYFGDMPQAVYGTSVFFDHSYLDNWLEDDLSQKIIKSLDKGEVIGPNCIQTKALGPIPPTSLAGGTKTLLLIRHMPEKVFNASTCGDNCAKWLLRIAKESDQDILINLRHLMNFDVKRFEIKVANTGKVVHNMEELILEAGVLV